MSKNVVVICNSLYQGGMLTYITQLCYGLIELRNRGEIDSYKMVIPVHILKSTGCYPKPLPAFPLLDAEDTVSVETDEEYFNQLKSADVIITNAHGQDDGLDRVPEEFFVNKDMILIIHSTADFAGVRKPDNYRHTIPMRHKFYNVYVMYREKLMEGLSKIEDKFGWTHLQDPNRKYVRNLMGHEVNLEARLPSSKPNNGIWYGRCNNSQKRFTRVAKGLAIYNPFDKFYFASNLEEGWNPWGDSKALHTEVAVLEDKAEIISQFCSQDIIQLLDNVRIAVLPSQYKDIGYPLEHVVTEAIVNKVVPVVTTYVAEQCEKYAPGFKFITIPEGWEEIDFKILDSFTIQDLDGIAQHNFDLYAKQYSPANVARNIINKESLLEL